MVAVMFPIQYLLDKTDSNDWKEREIEREKEGERVNKSYFTQHSNILFWNLIYLRTDHIFFRCNKICQAPSGCNKQKLNPIPKVTIT